MTLTIADILRGCRTGRLQTAGMMQVIPLLSELEDHGFALPSALEVSTATYGSLVIRNPTRHTALVPVHAGYVVKEAAQDHAMAHGGLIRPQACRKFTTAMCIQETQGGTISAGTHKLIILPYALREQAHAVRRETDYSKLWNALRKFNREFGLERAPGELVRFLDAFAGELDAFVAEFECVQGQVGAIVLVDGEVVGVERAPSQAFWSDIWSALIRECYGSWAISVARAIENPRPPSTRVPLRTEGLTSLDDLAEALKEAREAEAAAVKAKVRALLADPFTITREDDQGDFALESLKHEQLVGQILRRGPRIPYASLVVNKHWVADRAWRAAPAFEL